METDTSPYPLQLTGQLAPKLSRGLWLVKWLLAIPHFIFGYWRGVEQRRRPGGEGRIAPPTCHGHAAGWDGSLYVSNWSIAPASQHVGAVCGSRCSRFGWAAATTAAQPTALGGVALEVEGRQRRPLDAARRPASCLPVGAAGTLLQLDTCRIG